jgi:hypothetical protein
MAHLETKIALFMDKQFTKSSKLMGPDGSID